MMGSNAMVLAASAAFVGTHFLLSHPLRRPIVGRLGERGFLLLYSLVAILILWWMSSAYRAAPPGPMLWPAGDGLWALVTLLMLGASILFMGSLVGNPARPGLAGATPDAARGVFAITRHPMMWSFALWGLCHIIVYPVPANIIVALAIMLLALVGAALQDRKREHMQPEAWPAWEQRTSFWPGLAIAQGRARVGSFGMHTLAGGVVFWLAATWAHIPLAGWAAGVWRWIV